MDSVVNIDNMPKFLGKSIPVVLPRTFKHNDYLNYILEDIHEGDKSPYNPNQFPNFTFFSCGLDEFKEIYCEKHGYPVPKYVLIDIANGHMASILDIVLDAKELHDDLIVMVGNIANPETYKYYAESNHIDYIRIGIGNGNGCLTTQQTGIGYPKASLIAECYEVKKELEEKGILCPKIVADGGMKDYSDIIKALALGADYVMVGSIFNKALESSGDNYLWGFKVSQKFAAKYYKKLPIKKRFYGMSTKLAQKKLGNKIFKTSEGIVSYRKIEYTLEGWVENFDHYLRSAMSYTDKDKLKNFIGKVNINHITTNAHNRFKK